MLGGIEKLVVRGGQRIQFLEGWVMKKFWWRRQGLN